MQSPSSFDARLAEEFGDRLRIRWAETRGEWHIEEKVGRGIFDPPLPDHLVSPRNRDAQHERRVRARDGYDYVMAIRPGDRMPCPVCHLTCQVPVMEIREVVCAYCRAKGRDTTFWAAYFPLGEVLIDHLRGIDPLRDGHRRQMADVEAANKAREAAIDKKAEDERYDYLFDAAVGQIPSVGYTGREQAWEN